nr:MAG TPA_asm: hypothetical protein [Caudoviricetes sp.]
MHPAALQSCKKVAHNKGPYRRPIAIISVSPTFRPAAPAARCAPRPTSM